MSLVLHGLKGNAWSDEAEELLSGLEYEFRRIPPDVHPKTNPRVPYIPTLSREYTVDGDHSWQRLAAGLDEIREWVDQRRRLEILINNIEEEQQRTGGVGDE